MSPKQQAIALIDSIPDDSMEIFLQMLIDSKLKIQDREKILQNELPEITKRISQAVSPKKIYLFGSFARGDYRHDSDLDLYIVVPDGIDNNLKLGQEAYKALRGMRERRPIDILVENESTFEKRKKQSTIENSVAKEGILLYES